MPGTDGRKMSKSYNNSIFISDPEDEIRAKVMSFMTDPARKLKTDPGDPDICPLHQVHKLIADSGEIAEWDRCCRVADCGCVAHKRKLADDLVAYLAPFQERRRELAAIPASRRRCSRRSRQGQARHHISRCHVQGADGPRSAYGALGGHRREGCQRTCRVRSVVPRRRVAGSGRGLHGQDRRLRGALRPAAPSGVAPTSRRQPHLDLRRRRPYLEHIDKMSDLDLDVASEFLLLAATLLEIKAASLLPKQDVYIGDELDDCRLRRRGTCS